MLEAVTFPSPGFLGLNKQQAQIPLRPEWATVARNAVIDEAGRFAARKGWVDQTSTAISSNPDIRGLHEYINNTGTVTLIGAAGNDLYESTDNGAHWSSVKGAVTVSNDKWQFVNFNGKVLGVQASHAFIKKTSGNFSNVTASTGSVPTTPRAILSAFGRVWLLGNDYQTIYYSGLLDETDWLVDSSNPDGPGIIDMSQVWTTGTDTGVGLAAFSGRLLVFGKRHVVIWTDGAGATLGLSPANIYVEDVIEGVGLLARDSIKNIGEGDLIFASQNGVRSLVRVLQEQQTPINDITKNSRQYFNDRINNSSVGTDEICAVYSPEQGFYLLSVPDADLVMCVDVRAPLQDGTFRITEWISMIPTGMCRRTNGDLLFGFDGRVGKYTGYNDDGETYRFAFWSGFFDLQDQNGFFKELKRIRMLAYSPAGVTPIVKWWWDFNQDYAYFTWTYDPDTASQYNIDEYGTAQYGGTDSQRLDNIPAGGSGQFFRLGVEVDVDGSPFAIQSLTAFYTKGGKYA